MVTRQINYARRTVAALKDSVVRKTLALATGRNPVSRTCQIPGVRELYATLGLAAHHGTFVEIGAYDGEGFSNTSFLADQGWRGIYVEPVTERCTTVRLRHWLNSVTVEPVAASNTEGSCEIRVMDALTTLDAETADAYTRIGWGRKRASRATTRTIRLERLDTLLARNAVEHDFELMVVDVEGHELPVIEALAASPWRPRVLVVELVDTHADFAAFGPLQLNARKAREAILALGYAPVYIDEVNTVFALGGAGTSMLHKSPLAKS